MDSALRAHLDQHEGVLSTRAAARLGLTGNDLRALVRDGELERVAPGGYVDARLLQGSDPYDHHRHRARAIVLTRKGKLAASHQSAALLHGLPVLDKGLDAVRTVHTKDRVNTRHYQTYTVHPWPGPGGLTRRGRVPVVVPALAVLGTALAAGSWSGQMAVDAALRRELTSRQELESWLARMPHHRGITRARTVVELADSKSESPGESILRRLLLDLGYRVISQHPIRDAGSTFAWVDFFLPELGVVVEFDGMVKYRGRDKDGNPTVDGRSAKLVLEAERRREQRIVRTTGYGVARIVWKDLFDVRRIRAEIDAAAASRRRLA